MIPAALPGLPLGQGLLGMSNELVGTYEWLVSEIYQSHLADPGRLDDLVVEFARENPYADASAMGSFFTQRGIFTNFQIDRILNGEARSLVLGPYRLFERIGIGAMGTVYKAVGRADRQAYAVKVLPLRSQWNVRLARRQVRSFADLPPNPVVPFIDVGTAVGKHYLVWPFVTGVTLNEIVREHGPLNWQEAARIGLALAQGLQICHEHGIFHGLIKPSNVMIGDDGTVRLLDSGIGALLAENADESMLDTMSTANATASMVDCACPESLTDPSKCSPVGDQYSLGCTLYFCLAGKYPFPDEHLVDKMNAHQERLPPPLSDVRPKIGPQFIAVVDRLMQKAPTSRYRDIGEAALDLAAANGLPTNGFRGQLAPVDTPRAADLVQTPPGQRPAPSQSSKSQNWRPAAPPPLQPAKTPPPLAIPKLARPKSDSHLNTSMLSDTPSVFAVSASTPAPKPQVTPAPESGSVLKRAVRAMSFWRSERDTVSCSVLAPVALIPGESANMPLFLHSDTVDSIVKMARAYFPNHQLVATGTLSRELPRGSQVTFQMELPGIGIEPPRQTLVWQGQMMPLPFRVDVPVDFRPGEAVGAVSIGLGKETIFSGEFRVQVGIRV